MLLDWVRRKKSQSFKFRGAVGVFKKTLELPQFVADFGVVGNMEVFAFPELWNSRIVGFWDFQYF